MWPLRRPLYNDRQETPMSILIVTLAASPAAPATLYDYVLTPDGSTLGESSSAPLALLPLVGNSGEVVALVPAQQLSWHQVTLPKGALKRSVFREADALRLRAVLEGLLEDRLLDDTAQLHFAIEAAPRADAPVWVAVCDRAWLRAALQALEQSGHPVSRIVPEFAPDAPADVLGVTGEPDQGHLIFAAQGTVVVWPLTAASVALLNWPEQSRIVAEPAVAALAEQLFQRTVTLQQAPQRRLLAIQSSWDLAQFDLVNSNRARSWKRWSTIFASLLRAPHWRAARLALALLLVVNLAGLNAWAWKEQAVTRAQRQAIRDTLTTTFPKVQVVVDAPLQMAREVAILQQASGMASGADLEALLGVFAAAAPPGTQAAAVDYSAGELRLKGAQLTPEQNATISLQLKGQGYGLTAQGESLVIKQEAGL